MNNEQRCQDKGLEDDAKKNKVSVCLLSIGPLNP